MSDDNLETSPQKVALADETGRSRCERGLRKADDTDEETVKGQASEERIAEIKSGRIGFQQASISWAAR